MTWLIQNKAQMKSSVFITPENRKLLVFITSSFQMFSGDVKSIDFIWALIRTVRIISCLLSNTSQDIFLPLISAIFNDMHFVSFINEQWNLNFDSILCFNEFFATFFASGYWYKGLISRQFISLKYDPFLIVWKPFF